MGRAADIPCGSDADSRIQDASGRHFRAWETPQRSRGRWTIRAASSVGEWQACAGGIDTFFQGSAPRTVVTGTLQTFWKRADCTFVAESGARLLTLASAHHVFSSFYIPSPHSTFPSRFISFIYSDLEIVGLHNSLRSSTIHYFTQTIIH